MTVLEVRELRVSFPSETGQVWAVRDLSLTLAPGQILALVGESGAGKSATALALMGLLPAAATVSGSVRLQNQELLGLDDREWSKLRGRRIAMVFADDPAALTPVYSIGGQLVEALQIHQELTASQARARARELLELVGLPPTTGVFEAFPHEISGGQRQRVLIALALANDPAVLIADEPTSAVDVTVQAEVLAVLRRVREHSNTAIVLITHDLAVAAELADQVAVLYAGRAVEVGPSAAVLGAPRMPYTIGLVRSLPQLDGPVGPLPVIAAGEIAATGCAFAPRCPLANEECRSRRPELTSVTDGHQVACSRQPQVEAASPEALFAAPSVTTAPARGAAEVVLSVRGVRHSYRRRGRGWDAGRTVVALDGVDLDLRAGQTVGVVGESGCGKTTLLRSILELSRPRAGRVMVLGTDVATLTRRSRRDARRRLQVVFQDPMAALDPRLPVADILAEPLVITGWSRAAIPGRIGELLALVGLSHDHAHRFPQQLSGGQRQRVGIARALATEPSILLLDEPVSALDASVRSGVLNLLQDLQTQLGLAYLLVGHDLAVVRQLADQMVVMRAGRFVEIGPAPTVLTHPAHPYTVALRQAVPSLNPTLGRNGLPQTPIDGLPPAALRGGGCPYRGQCLRRAGLAQADRDRCDSEDPALVLLGADHRAACHFTQPVAQ
ncbi:MAG TPA: peptide ABC transporter ATP-binding protein [Propionibacteriaceae bacterium]|nr:peptide ABC transporter ATP-binding protein [Propionibacteriaceae bacterium]